MSENKAEGKSDLERAIAIAVEAHAGQRDRVGRAYILHPLRVMMAMQTDNERIVAILHDVVEDNPAWTLDRLRAEGFDAALVDAIDHITRREEESYEEFVQRAASNPLALRVKRADLRDNMDITRLETVDEKTRERLQRYLSAWKSLPAE